MLITPVCDPCSSSLSHPRVALITGHLEQSFSSNPTGRSELPHPLMTRAPGSYVGRTFLPCPMAEPTVHQGQSLVRSVRMRSTSWRPFIPVRRGRLDACTLRQHSARPRGIIVRDERCAGRMHSRLSASGALRELTDRWRTTLCELTGRRSTLPPDGIRMSPSVWSGAKHMMLAAVLGHGPRSRPE